jgi:hypothetical protein
MLEARRQENLTNLSLSNALDGVAALLEGVVVKRDVILNAKESVENAFIYNTYYMHVYALCCYARDFLLETGSKAGICHDLLLSAKRFDSLCSRQGGRLV